MHGERFVRTCKADNGKRKSHNEKLLRLRALRIAVEYAFAEFWTGTLNIAAAKCQPRTPDPRVVPAERKRAARTKHRRGTATAGIDTRTNLI